MNEFVREEVLQGLAAGQKKLPCKLFYDQAGSELFERICDLDEYYLTRTEVKIMHRHIGEMAERLGPALALVEYGSGSSMKTRLLLDHLEDPIAYIPIDISKDFLRECAASLAEEYPHLQVIPLCADYTSRLTLPPIEGGVRSCAVYFPGSTIGNFEPGEAEEFLARVRQVCRAEGSLLIGVDLEKDPSILEAAYNDRAGVTADFNLNLLRRLNREVGADFELENFRHQAYFNSEEGRVEMHLESLADQEVAIGSSRIPFKKGETIHTECSYKYTLERFGELASRAGFSVAKVWTDEREFFSVQHLVAE